MRDDDLTPKEREAFETLPRERMPSAGLEDRVVGSLRERGVLGRRRRVIALTPLRVASLAAASLAFVVAGFALGQWTTLRQVGSPLRAFDSSRSSDLSAAAALQYTATAYLLALENVASLPDSTKSDDVRQGREVALKTLYTAADRVSRMVPRDVLAGQLLNAIDVGVETGPPAGAGDATTDETVKRIRSLAWF